MDVAILTIIDIYWLALFGECIKNNDENRSMNIEKKKKRSFASDWKRVRSVEKKRTASSPLKIKTDKEMKV